MFNSIFSITLIAYLGLASASPSMRVWQNTCKIFPCEEALKTCVESGCMGQNCITCVELYSPLCSRCTSDALREGYDVFNNGTFYLLCDSAISFHLTTCSFYCRYNLKPVGKCVHANNYPLCICLPNSGTTTTEPTIEETTEIVASTTTSAYEETTRSGTTTTITATTEPTIKETTEIVASTTTSAYEIEKTTREVSAELQTTVENESTFAIESTTSPNKPSYQNGLTFRLLSYNDTFKVSHLGCWGDKTSSDCDHYHGDTDCDQELPILCLYDSNPIGSNPGFQVDEQSHWTGKVVVETEPVKGSSFADLQSVNSFCESRVGKNWRYVDWQQEGSWSFYVYAHLSNKTRYWIVNSATNANCWN